MKACRECKVVGKHHADCPTLRAARVAPADLSIEAYRELLKRKVALSPDYGFVIDPDRLHPSLKPHQRAIAPWAIRGGRRAIFSSFGTGKTRIQLEVLRLILEEIGGIGLIVAPLGVRQEFEADAAVLGIALRFIQTTADASEPGIYITNYESVRDGKLDPRGFTVATLDEAAILSSFGGTKTFREFMRLFDSVPYRFVATATPDPNDFIEILAYSAFLGILDVGEAKTRFFKRDSTKADKLTLHAHKASNFWHWVSSWAVFLGKPSDICECICHKESNSQGKDLESFSSRGGKSAKQEGPGYASVTAAVISPLPQITSPPESSSAADAFGKNTEEKGPARIVFGSQCATGAQGDQTRTGKTMAEEASTSANVGENSATFSQTWENRQSGSLSNESIIAGTTSLETASGQPEQRKPAIPEDQLFSPIPEDRNQSLPGPKNSGSTIGGSTGDTRPGGATNEFSPTCCDACRCDEGYDLPPLEVVLHEIPVEHTDVRPERDGQGRLYREAMHGVVEAAREKRDTLVERVAAAKAIMDSEPDEHFLLWHDLEAERHEIERTIPGVTTVYGAQRASRPEELEAAVRGFATGTIQSLAAKPSMFGAGANWQRHCAREIFVGIGFKFRDFIQAIHRTYRFLQTRKVVIHLIYAASEKRVLETLMEKWERYKLQAAEMSKIIREYGLSGVKIENALMRSMGIERAEVRGETYTLANNDCVEELEVMTDNSVGLILSSLPFSTQYEYVSSFNDFGYNDSNESFFEQMDFLTVRLLRVMKPGRLAVIHVKDRITPGGINGLGFQTVYPFHVDCINHFIKHGFGYMGMKTIVTDVVRENNQTYRLGWTEQCKDGTKMGVGMPEYLLIFRKPPTDTSNGYADEPVVKSKRQYSAEANDWESAGDGFPYSRSRWQIDAHGFERSSGNRLLMPYDFDGQPHATIFKMFRKHSLSHVYDYEHHVALGESLEAKNILPVTFMLLQPQSWHPDVWSDVTRMRTLNGAQSAKGRELHLCPIQLDIVDRIIDQCSAAGDLVMDMFSGLGTVPSRAVAKGRRGYGVELSTSYWMDSQFYCDQAEKRASMPTLFDLVAVEEEEALADELPEKEKFTA